MKYLSIFTPDQTTPSGPPSPEHMAAMGKLTEEAMKSGVLVSTGGLLPLSKGGARVRSKGGDITVIDGPFTESKEIIAGFAVLEVKSKEEAIESAREFLEAHGGDGECEVRQMMEPGEGRPNQ